MPEDWTKIGGFQWEYPQVIQSLNQDLVLKPMVTHVEILRDLGNLHVGLNEHIVKLVVQLLVVQHGHLTINDYKDLSGDVIKIEGYTTNIQHISNMIVSNGGTLMGCFQQVHNWEINILHQNVDKLHKNKKLQLSHADYLQSNMEPNK